MSVRPKYIKKHVPLRPTQGPARILQNLDRGEVSILGMLYIVEVQLFSKKTGEKIRHKLLIVGGEQSDIERKLSWVFDAKKYEGITIRGIEKVREKVHFLSTSITQIGESFEPIVSTDEGSKVASGVPTHTEPYDPLMFAIGLSTTMLAKDPEHALRKLGHALISRASEGKSHAGAKLSADSTLAVEQIPMSSGYAKPRDVSNESNQATFVRG